MTDRGLRYRANAAMPAGPRLCHYCGNPNARLDVDHVDGFEEHNEPKNLSYACRPCNTRKGQVFADAGIGRKTRQYNPHASFSDAAAGLAGRRVGADARKTSGALPFGAFDTWLRRHLPSLSAEPSAQEVKAWRQAFMKGASQRRANPSGANSGWDWYQATQAIHGYPSAFSVAEAVEMIHATCQAKRRRFAADIWDKRRQQGTASVPRHRREEVPF